VVRREKVGEITGGAENPGLRAHNRAQSARSRRLSSRAQTGGESMSDETFPLSDLALSRRLERSEARANAAFVESRAKVFPASGARWMEVAGAYAMFDGVASPCTQTFGLGLFAPVGDAEMEELESFFGERGAPVFHEVSPLADAALPALLNERGYRPVEFTSVLYQPLRADARLAATPNERVRVRVVGENEAGVWARTLAEGWSESAGLTDFLIEMGSVTAGRSDALCFLAEIDSEPVAAATMSLCGGVALLAGASTIPAAGGGGGGGGGVVPRELPYLV
jgi:hypothetical protein